MSQKKPINLACPSCGARTKLDYYQSANVIKDPHLKDLIINFKINIVTCESCDQNVFIDDFFVYNDPESGLFVTKFPLSDLDKWKSIQAKDDFDDGIVEIYKIGLFGQLGKEFFNKSHRLFYHNLEGDYLQFVLVNIEESKEVNLVKVPKEVFTEFSQISFPRIKEKELVSHILESPFVSMEKVYFAKEMMKEFLN